MIENAKVIHAKDICEIYNYYIENTIITFEEELLEPEDIQQRIVNISEKYPWLVYVENDHVIGYAYATAWKLRNSYRFAVETTVYLNPNYSGKGIGSLLYKDLIVRLQKLNMHTVIAGISLPNDNSIAFHEKFGFHKIGQFKSVGYKFNKWIDVGYWELIL